MSLIHTEYYESIRTALRSELSLFAEVLCFPLFPFWRSLVVSALPPALPFSCWSLCVCFSLLFLYYYKPWPSHPPPMSAWDPGGCSHGGEEMASWVLRQHCSPHSGGLIGYTSSSSYQLAVQPANIDWLKARCGSSFRCLCHDCTETLDTPLIGNVCRESVFSWEDLHVF